MAATSMVLVGGAGAAGLSAQAFSELIEAAERSQREGSDCASTLGLLARDSRDAVRALVAELAGSLWVEEREPATAVLRDLARDSSQYVRAAAAVGLARAIRAITPGERIEVACEWALSPDVRDRAAVARALAWPTPVLVTDLVIDQLSTDPDAEVRALAMRAAATHIHEDTATYTRLAKRLLSDSSAEVRAAAGAVLERAI